MKKILAKTLLAFALVTSLIAVMPVVHAGNNDFRPTPLIRPSTLPGPDGDAQGDKGARNFLVDVVLPRFAVAFIGTIGGISLLFVIIGGVRFATIFDNEEAIEKAKKQVIYGIVGFLLALLSYTIVRAIINFDFKIKDIV